ncbi:MAG: radical SAM protein [Acidaminobacteraceae bacterium]
MKSKRVIIPIFVSHQGCPNDCVFCNQRSITGVDNSFDASKYISMIDEYLDSIKNIEDTTVEIAFYGGSFTGIEKELQEKYLKLAYIYIKSGVVDGIRLSTRPDYIDEEILKLLKMYGVTTIELGVQSFDEHVLRLSNRGHDSDIVYEKAKMIKDYGFILGIQLMIGLPGDDYNTSIESAKCAARIKPDIARIYPTLVIKDTELASMYENGFYKPLTLDDAIISAKEMYKILLDADINVIRIGLQPTENILEGNDVICGPFHPSFRHLVESKILLEEVESRLETNDYSGKEMLIQVKEKKISEMIGIKKENIKYLQAKYGFKKIKVIGLCDSVLYINIVIKDGL